MYQAAPEAPLSHPGCHITLSGVMCYTFPCSSAGKESACNVGSIPGLGRSPGEGSGYPFQYSGLENSMGCIDHGVTKSRARLSDCHFLPFYVLYSMSWKQEMSEPVVDFSSLICLFDSCSVLMEQNFGRLFLVSNHRRRTTEDKMVGWPHWLNEHEFEQTPGDAEGQRNPDMLQSVELQIVRHDWVIEHNKEHHA